MSGAGRLVDRIWYGESSWRWSLVPLSALFALLRSVRHMLFRSGVWRAIDVGRPVIVVGNITAGGTGKTPISLWLAEQLRARGRRPGIVSRGYRGRIGPHPLRVATDSDPAQVGDEPLLMERRRICPVVVHPDRVAAARLLVEMDCDVIVADDGLQHYRLHRQYEIVVIDAERGLGNGRLLPAGPLREPPGRLAAVDYLFIQRENDGSRAMQFEIPHNVPCATFELLPRTVCNLADGRESMLAAFAGRPVHAVAGIAHPERFFRLLEAHGIEVIPHAHEDHAKLGERDLRFDDGLDVLMTEKDAARCRDIAAPNCWYVVVDVAFDGSGPLQWLDEVCRAMHEREAGKRHE